MSEISAKMKSLSDEKNQVTRTFFNILNTDKNGCQCKLGIHEETVIVLYYSKFMISDFHLAISAIYRQKDQTIEKEALHLITRKSLTFAAERCKANLKKKNLKKEFHENLHLKNKENEK